MTVDARILLAGRGVEAPDMLHDANRRQVLQNLARAGQIQDFDLEQRRRNEASVEGVGDALGGLDVFDDEQVKQAIMRAPPESREALAMHVWKQRKERAGVDKDTASASEHSAKAAAQKFEFVGGIAGVLAKNPNRQAWLASKDTLQRAGVDPSILDVPDGVDPVQHFSQLAQGSIGRAKQLEFEDKEKQRGLTAARDAATRENYLRTDSRSRDANAAQMANAAANRAQAWAVHQSGKENAQAIRDAARETATAGRVNADTQALSKQVDANALPNLITSATALNETMSKYAGKRDMPGVGVWDSNVPPLLRSAEGNKVKGQIQAVANDLLKLYSGGAVTANEAERRATEMMASGQFNESDLRSAWPLVVGRINAATQNVRAGYSPEAVQTYEGRGGIPLKAIDVSGARPSSRDDAIKQALEAISKGAPRDKVLQRLREMGITDARI